MFNKMTDLSNSDRQAVIIADVCDTIYWTSSSSSSSVNHQLRHLIFLSFTIVACQIVWYEHGELLCKTRLYDLNCHSGQTVR